MWSLRQSLLQRKLGDSLWWLLGHKWCADHVQTAGMWKSSLHWEMQDQGTFSWMMSSAMEMNHICGNALLQDGQHITVGTEKMPVCFAQVHLAWFYLCKIVNCINCKPNYQPETRLIAIKPAELSGCDTREAQWRQRWIESPITSLCSPPHVAEVVTGSKSWCCMLRKGLPVWDAQNVLLVASQWECRKEMRYVLCKVLEDEVAW